MLSHGSSPKPEGQPRTGGTGTVCVTWCRSKDREPEGGEPVAKEREALGKSALWFLQDEKHGSLGKMTDTGRVSISVLAAGVHRFSRGNVIFLHFIPLSRVLFFLLFLLARF